MREDALTYHQRNVNDFIKALFDKADAKDEAVNVLLSANNLENQGYTQIFFKKEAEDYLKPELQIIPDIPKSEEARIFSSIKGDTLAERAPKRHRIMREIFNDKDFVDAVTEGNDDKIDAMVRALIGWRKQSIPNMDKKHHKDNNHSLFDAMGLFPSRSGDVSYNEMPLFQEMKRFLYGKGGEKARELTNAMVKTADKMNPRFKTKSMFDDWRGNDANLMKFYNLGLEEFKQYFKDKYKRDLHEPQDLHFLRVKNWENEGIPRDTIMKYLYGEDGGILHGKEKDKQTAVEKLRGIADDFYSRGVRPMKDQDNFGRLGVIPYRLGIYMLPYNDIFNIMKWMVVTNGGMKDDGTINDDFLNQWGYDMRGYMAHHAYLMDNVLNTIYSGGSERRGMSHRIPNRYLKNTHKTILDKLDAKKEEMRNDMQKNRWSSINQEQLKGGLRTVNLEEIAERFGDVVDAGGPYPHIVDDEDFGSYVEMKDTLPDMRELIRNDFFDEDEIEKITNNIVENYEEEIKRRTIASSLHDYQYTHSADDDFEINEKPNINLTPKGILMEGLGHRGNLNGSTGDWGVALDEGFQNVLRAPLPERRFLSRSRQERDALGSSKTVEQMDEYDPRKDIDGQTKKQLEKTLQREEYDYLTAEEKDKLLSDFDDNKVVRLPVPRKNLSLGEEVKDLGESGDPSQLIEDFTEDMPIGRTIATPGLNSFFMAHNDGEIGLTDDEDFPALDNILRDSKMTTLHTPMHDLRMYHLNARNKNKNTLMHVQQLPDDKKGYTNRNISYHHDDLSQQDRLLIDALLLGMHDPLHEFDDDKFEKLKKTLNPNNTNPLESLMHPHHTDLIGYGGRNAQDMLRETMSEDYGVDSTYAIYDQEDYENFLNHFGNFLQNDIEYRPPNALVKNIKTKTSLLRELKNKDHAFRNAQNEKEKGQRAIELEKLVNNSEDERGKVVAIHHYNQEGEDIFQPLVVAPSPSALISEHEGMLQRRLHYAHVQGDEDAEEMLNKKLMSLRKNLPNDVSIDNELNYQNDRLRTHIDTINATKKVFDVLRKPIQEMFPDAFKGNNAWATTSYLARVAEYITSLSPEQREKIFNNKENIVFAGKKLSFDLQPSQIEDLKNLHVSRRTYQDAEDNVRNMKDSLFGGVQPKGHEMVSKLFEVSSKQKAFDEIMNNINEAAKSQNISFDDAFASRYMAHDARTGNALKGYNAKLGIDERSDAHKNMGGVKTAGNYMHNEGGMFHQRGENAGLLHGGESVVVGGKPLTMSQERDIICEAIKNAEKQIRLGSDSAFDFNLFHNNHFKSKDFMNNKVLMPLNDVKKISKLRNIGKLLGDRTQTDKKNVTATPYRDTKMGGFSFDNAPSTPIMSSRHHQFHYGHSTELPFFMNMQGLHDGNLILENDQFHSYNPSPTMPLPMPRDIMRYFNNDLKPLDMNQPSPFKYTPFEFTPNPNIRAGRNIATQNITTPTDESLFQYSSVAIDVMLDDTLIMKEDGKPMPVKFMHRIFDLEDMKHLRGFTGDWVISLYPQGEHIIVTKKGKKMSAYGADGEVKLDDVFKEEMNKVHDKDFIVHAILHDGIMTIIDLLKTGDEDTHNMPTKDRIRHLRAQYESSEHIKMPEPINTKRSDDEGLKVAIEGLRNENNIDILLRDANATYMKGEPRHPKWILLSKEKMVDIIVLSRAGTNYTIGVGPLMHPEHYGKRAQQIGDEYYMNVGNAKGPRGLNVGDFATVRCTGVSASNNEHPVYRIRSAKITDNEPLAADSVETLSILVGEHHVPQQVQMKKGKITIYFPAFDDEVICKNQDGFIIPQSSLWGNEYLVKLARDQEAYWELKAAWLLKEEEVEEEPEYDEVTPEPPAGHSKKRKHILDEEEEIIKRGLELLERGLEELTKEKITSTGVQGLGIDYATPDESPRGPTQNIRDNTMPDFDPQARTDDELKPAESKKTKRLKTSRGEEATLEDNGVIAIDNRSIDIP